MVLLDKDEIFINFSGTILKKAKGIKTYQSPFVDGIDVLNRGFYYQPTIFAGVYYSDIHQAAFLCVLFHSILLYAVWIQLLIILLMSSVQAVSCLPLLRCSSPFNHSFFYMRYDPYSSIWVLLLHRWLHNLHQFLCINLLFRMLH